MEQLFNRQEQRLNSGNSKKIILIFNSIVYNTFRNISLIGFILIAFWNFSYAQKTHSIAEQGDISSSLRSDYERHADDKVKEIPIGTRNEFDSDFSNVEDVTWKVGPGYSEAEFMQDGKLKMAFFNYDDELIGNGYYVDYSALPKKGVDRIAKDYGDYTPEKAMYYEDDLDDDDFLNFFGNFLQEDAYFVLLRRESDNKEIVVQVTQDGDVSYFSNVRVK